ncbi:MAG: hypothetical protein OXE59_08055 [Bacteroidetes bacterium]|nr:hypothetical protein [Bacteroidota bacterium]
MSKKEVLVRAQHILLNIGLTKDVISVAYEIRKYIIDLTLSGSITESEFYQITSLLSPQSRSPLWEKYFIAKHDCDKVSKSAQRGDIQKNGMFYEFKASGFNQDGGLHIVQIRLWHDCDYIIQSISNAGAITFVLSHADMKRETILLSAQSAHGTESVTEANTYNELRMTVKKDSDDWERWVDTYKVAKFPV